MLFNRISCFLLLIGITQLAHTNAYLPRLPVNYAGHQAGYSRSISVENVLKDERIAAFKKEASRVERNGFVTKLSAATTDDDGATEANQATLLGALVLLTVPLSWGTYVPVGE